MAKTGPAPLIDERQFVPADLGQARELYERLIHAGVPLSRARGVVTWLITLPEKRSEDPTSNVTRRDYRLALRALGGPPWGGGRVNEDKGALISSHGQFEPEVDFLRAFFGQAAAA